MRFLVEVAGLFFFNVLGFGWMRFKLGHSPCEPYAPKWKGLHLVSFLVEVADGFFRRPRVWMVMAVEIQVRSFIVL